MICKFIYRFLEPQMWRIVTSVKLIFFPLINGGAELARLPTTLTTWANTGPIFLMAFCLVSAIFIKSSAVPCNVCDRLANRSSVTLWTFPISAITGLILLMAFCLASAIFFKSSAAPCNDLEILPKNSSISFWVVAVRLLVFKRIMKYIWAKYYQLVIV